MILIFQFDFREAKSNVHVESLIKNLLKGIEILLVIRQRIELLRAVCATLNCGYPFSHVARCELLDQFESTQQNRFHPGQIKAQLIILIDKRRLHAWRQIFLRKIDDQFLMYVVSHILNFETNYLVVIKLFKGKKNIFSSVIHIVLTSSQQACNVSSGHEIDADHFCHYYLKVV
ncbi:hypothetical protein T4A_5238 [Trichinella pseudospiralis]|uniref:Uncharacterized protein n=1 Tax=Trichinella pseudospiralis TaxID=6337 RepID=A0A0V1EZB2_TRIPS|nr:hypothetical protein T4A_5238 [Trichinella pseudospiralis]KRZ45811.1 hypothetical protein T4C_13412 [Trichinella pseudospiralis]